MCIHCSAGEHEDCNCEERDNEIRVLQEQIARLTAEVERHRMTPEERRMAASAIDFMSDPGIDPEPYTMNSEIHSLQDYLARSEPKKKHNK